MLSNTTRHDRRPHTPASAHGPSPVDKTREIDTRQPGTSYAATLIDLARLLARQAADEFLSTSSPAGLAVGAA